MEEALTPPLENKDYKESLFREKNVAKGKKSPCRINSVFKFPKDEYWGEKTYGESQTDESGEIGGGRMRYPPREGAASEKGRGGGAHSSWVYLRTTKVPHFSG